MDRVVVDNVSKKFKIGFKKNQGALARCISLFSGVEPKKTIWALKDVSFSVKAGEIFGIIGRNGSGKSTLLRVIAGIYQSDEGNVLSRGKVASLIDLTSGLRDGMKMRDNIEFCGTLFGLTGNMIKDRFDAIVSYSELEEFLETKIYQFSDGMKSRLAFALAINCDADVMIFDEIFGVGDLEFRDKSLNKIKDLVSTGKTVLLASHTLELVEKYCHNVIVLDDGKIITRGDARVMVDQYRRKKYTAT